MRLDPTALFALVALTVPVLKAGSVDAIVWNFLLDPAFLFCVFLLYVSRTAWPSAQKLAPWEERMATWFLINGACFHVFMDGLCGGLGYGGELNKQYHKLDARFANHDNTVFVITVIEMTMQAPLCFLTYRAIQRGLPSRDVLVMLTSVLHFIGLVVFAGVELKNGCTNIPASEPVGGAHGPCFSNIIWPPTENQATFFWFGFVACNIPWIVVPLRLTWMSYHNIVANAAQVARVKHS